MSWGHPNTSWILLRSVAQLLGFMLCLGAVESLHDSTRHLGFTSVLLTMATSGISWHSLQTDSSTTNTCRDQKQTSKKTNHQAVVFSFRKLLPWILEAVPHCRCNFVFSLRGTSSTLRGAYLIPACSAQQRLWSSDPDNSSRCGDKVRGGLGWLWWGSCNILEPPDLDSLDCFTHPCSLVFDTLGVFLPQIPKYAGRRKWFKPGSQHPSVVRYLWWVIWWDTLLTWSPMALRA